MEVPIGDTYYFLFTTRDFDTGAPQTLAGTPALDVYEESTVTPITGGATVSVSHNSVVGLNLATVVVTSGNQYDVGNFYSVVISSGTVDGVSVVGEVVGHFRVMPAEDAGVGIKDVNVTHVSDESAPADNLELQYDGTTGLSGGTFPSSQAQVDSIASGSSAVNVGTIDAPNGFSINGGNGTVVSGDSDDTRALDLVRHELTDSAGTLDCQYEFDIGGDGVPTSVTLTGVFSSTNDAFTIQANSGTDATPVWNTLGTINGTSSSGNEVHTFSMLDSYVVSDISGRVQIRINGTGLSSSTFNVDQILVAKSVVSRTAGYSNGAIWVDTNGTGYTGSSPESYVDGTSDNPVGDWAAAKALVTQVGLKRFHLAAGTAITLDASADEYEFVGYGASVAMGNQSIDGATFDGLTLSGLSQYTSVLPTFTDCSLADTATTIPPCRMYRCGIGANTLTLGEAGDVFMVDCYSKVAGSSSPTFDLGNLVGASNISIRRWAGGLQINNILASDVISAECVSGGTLDLNGTGGTVEIRGMWKQVDTAGLSGATVNDFAISHENILAVSSRDEPDGQVAPPPDTTLAEKIDYIYKFLINKKTSDANFIKVYDQTGAVVEHQAAISDDGTTFTQDEYVAGT